MFAMYVIAFVLQLLNVWFSGLDGLYVYNFLDFFLLVCHCCVGGTNKFEIARLFGLASRLLTFWISLVF